eukprot:6070515-Pyramimonas_sp.AAC.1
MGGRCERLRWTSSCRHGLAAGAEYTGACTSQSRRYWALRAPPCWRADAWCWNRSHTVFKACNPTARECGHDPLGRNLPDAM